METIKKLSHGHFLGAGFNAAKLAKLLGDADRYHVMRVAGLAMDAGSVTTTYGESAFLLGSFIATEPRTGEQVKAAKIFLPDVAMLPLAAACRKGAQPQFVVDIYARLDEKSSVGFSYTVEEAVESQEDPVAALLAAAQVSKPLALAAPKSDEKPAGETPTAPAKTTKGKK